MSWRDIRNPASGGAEIFTHEVAKRWAEWGHDVTLLASGYKNSVGEERIDRVDIVRVGNSLTVYTRARRTYRKRFLGNTDVIIDEINTRPFLTPRYAGTETPVFALIFQLAREFWFYETPFPISVVGRYLLEDYWLRAYCHVPTFTISKSTQDDLLALDFSDVTIVPVGVSYPVLSELPEKAREPTVAYVGRLKKAKLPDHALKAFEIIREQVPNARLSVIGEGYLRRRIERDAPRGVSFFGWVSEELKIELLRRAHVLLYPAVREGWGLTIMEANALGTPAVGYDVPGIRDSIRHGETGFRVPFGDVSRLAEHAVSLLTDEPRRRLIAENALRWAARFNWEDTARKMLERIGNP